VIHDDGDALDALTRLFESSGFDVIAAVTGFRAQQQLESDRKIDVVIAPWDLGHVVGGDVYRWALQRRYDLRDQFVFLAAEPPAEFDRVVAGRCLAVSMQRPGEVARVALATIRRAENLELMRGAAITIEGDRTALLRVDGHAHRAGAAAGQRLRFTHGLTVDAVRGELDVDTLLLVIPPGEQQPLRPTSGL